MPTSNALGGDSEGVGEEWLRTPVGRQNRGPSLKEPLAAIGVVKRQHFCSSALKAAAQDRGKTPAEPPAATALRRAMAWQVELQGGTSQSEIAQRERLTRARVSQIMRLIQLPEHLKAKLLANDPSVTGMTIRKAIVLAQGPWTKRLRLIVEGHQELSSG